MDRLTAGGTYDHILVRTSEGWKIKKAGNYMIWRDGKPEGAAAASYARVDESL